jgi:hypothetical protein
MTTKLTTVQQPEVASWGVANPLRGANHAEAAHAFLKEFAIGTTLSVDAFDDWAIRMELLPPMQSREKNSDGWLAHLQRRHQVRYNINKAAAHPRMADRGGQPYVIESASQGVLEVRTMPEAYAKNTLPERINSLCVNRRKRLGHLMQSADWSVLAPHQRIFAEALFTDITNFEEMVTLSTKQLTSKFDKLERDIKRAMLLNELKPVDGGIRQLIAPENNE